MALGRSSRDQVFLNSFGVTSPTLAPQAHKVERTPNYYPDPNQDASKSTHGTPVYYIGMNPEIWKSYSAVPTNQGQRAAIAQRQSMMFEPRNSPSRSQFNEGYTIPVQQFKASNAWNTPSAQNTAGQVARQPSTKRVSPFSTATTIPTRMPWDL